MSNVVITMAKKRQGERGQWAVYYTSSQSLLITFFYSLAWQSWNLIGWFIKLSFSRGNFVYHHLGCTSIYRPLSPPFRSLQNSRLQQFWSSEGIIWGQTLIYHPLSYLLALFIAYMIVKLYEFLYLIFILHRQSSNI